MTTTIIVQAHCDSETKEVEVIVKEGGDVLETWKLQDGEENEFCAYDDREIIVKEVLK